MTQINFIPIDYDYFDINGKNYAKIVGRTDKGKKVCIIDECDVYFWAILHDDVKERKVEEIRKEIESIQVEKSGRRSCVLKTEVHDKNFLGRPVKAIKIFIPNFKDAHAIADKIDYKEIEKRREYDLDFTTKYIMDRKLKPLYWYEIQGEILNNSQEYGGIDNCLDVDLCLKIDKITPLKDMVFKPKVLSYDIETDEFEIGKGHIVLISLVGENFKKVLTWKRSSNKPFVEKLKDEEEMIKKFIEYVKDYNPDILTGYFSDGFDLPYLKARAEANKMKLNLGIDGSSPIFSRGRLLTGKIRGIVHVDLYRFIKTAYSQYLQSETLSLNEVASELLDEKKLDHEFKHSSKLNNDEWENFFDYNLQDSVLTYKLFDKIWPDMQEFTRIVQEPLFSITRDGMSSIVENYVIHNLEKYNEIADKRPLYDEIGERIEREKYEGAYVFQPKPGLYENIAFFDFTSMYGSVIVTYNLSKSTFSDKKIKDSHEVELEKKKAYFIKKPGFFPEMLSEIIDKRKQYKKEYGINKDPISKARSNAFKLIANAAYGYQGFFGARYYCLEAAAATAALARKHIMETIDFINKKDYVVVYSDTDSIAFNLGKHTQKQALELLSEINKKLPGIMELDLEDFYKRGIWVTKRTGEFGAKKKYALIDEENKIKIRGFETVRRDWCDLARVTQSKVLEYILKEGNEKKALEYTKQVIKKLKERKIELKEIMIRTQLKKSIDEYKSEGPHVTIAKKMKELGLPIKIGTLMEYFISEPESHQKTKTGKSKGPIRDRALLPDEKGEYDIDYYLNNQIIPAVENIFEVFGINTKELIEGKKQMNLGEF